MTFAKCETMKKPEVRTPFKYWALTILIKDQSFPTYEIKKQNFDFIFLFPKIILISSQAFTVFFINPG